MRWDLEEAGTDLFPAQLNVSVINEPGALGVVATIIGEAGANIDNVKIETRSPDFRDILIDIEVTDLKHLNSIMSKLKTKAIISKVERVNG